MNPSTLAAGPQNPVQPPGGSSCQRTSSDSTTRWSRPFAWLGFLAALVLLLVSAPAARAQQTPVGCTGSGLGINLFTSSPDVHVGDTLTYSVNVFNGIPGSPRVVCDAIDIVAGIVTPDGKTNFITLVRRTLHNAEADFYPDVVSYVVRAQDIRTDGTVRATAFDDGTILQNDTPSRGGGDQGVNTEVSQPCIGIGVVCLGTTGENGRITFSGSVTNCGNNTLVGVTVTSVEDNGAFRLVFTNNILRGAVIAFSGSFEPLNPCTADKVTLVATGVDQFTSNPRTVTASASTTCATVLTPAIVVTKVCPVGPVAPGQLLVYIGTVRNTGNVTLTNVTVTSDQPANTVVFTVASLAPGVTANYTGSYVAPVACSSTSGVIARGNSICGVPVSSTASSTCAILTTPLIAVTTVCSTNVAIPGGVQTYAGTVRNTGDIPLKNVVVKSDRPAANTTVFTVASLAPGASANFTGTYTVPLLNACAVTTTVVASGQDLCTDVAVTSTSAVTCGVTTAPQIAVTLSCPAVPVATGALITYSGTVRNSGNVTLNNVSVVNTQSSPPTVFTVASLAPGASANFTAAFTAPADACSVSSTVTASGSDNCTTAVVTAAQSATCALITTPRLVITQDCPTGSVMPGGLLTYSGTVRNSGDITVTNVVVLNSRGGVTPIFTAALLAPGATANFSGSFTAPLDACSVSSTSTVSATSVCGIPVSSSVSSVCPLLTTPVIAVTTVCSTNVVAPGGALTYRGTVRNDGNVTLTNVVVTSDRPLAGTVLFTVATLAPAATANFTGTYTAPASFPAGACGVTATVTATGRDRCTAEIVSSTATASCAITTTPQIAVTLNCPVVPVGTGKLITYTGTVSNPGNVTLNNVTVINAQSSPATVLTVVTLAPGASANFTASFTAPADACDVTTSVTASGSDNCTSLVVSASRSATCTLVTAPLIAITQECPPEPVAPGGLFTFSGTVRNAGDITLTNVVVSRTDGAGNPEVQEPATFGLVGYWALNETAGNVALDGSGAGNAGTLNNAVRGTGKLGNGLSFNGVNSSVIVPNNAGLNFTGPITLAAWIRPESRTGKQNILAHGYTLTPERSVYLRINDGHYEIGSQLDGTQPIAAAQMPASDVGTFVHVAGAYNGSTWVIYRNGVAMNTFVSPVGAVAVNAGWAIGARDGGVDRNFIGVIDEARIYNRALSATEILVLAGQVITVPNPPVSTPVFTVATLAPGESAAFTGSYLLPSVGACSVTTTLTVRAGDKCTGANVGSSVTRTCPLLTTPGIEVTQTCPVSPTGPGGLLTYVGTVRNTGNITLTNVTVVNSRSGPTPVLTLASLAPGASASFTGSYRVPLNCCTVSSTATAGGGSICTGELVADTATSTCIVTTAPQIAVTKVCPILPLAPGELAEYSGTVRNSGDITLVNVFVVNNRNGDRPVLGPLTLAPGESAEFTDSYVVNADFCGTDTVTANGMSMCEIPVTASVTTTCPLLTDPAITVTKNCPLLPTPFGGLYTYTGTVRNIGNVTLVNVFVVNNQPSNNTPVLGPITLAPGASADFTAGFIAPMDCCEITDSVTATGRDRCTGTTVSARASTVCPLLTTPRIAVAKTCPATSVPVGGLFTFGGSVTNTGDVNLTNVMVFSARPGGIRVRLLGPVELAPGEAATFSGSYTVVAGSDPTTELIEATGMDTCQARTVTARADCSGPAVQTDAIILRSVSLAGGVATVTWDSTPGITYTLQCKANAEDPIWINIPGNVTANAASASKTDNVGPTAKRFYRVVVAE